MASRNEIDAIKRNLAEKSSAELQALIAAQDREQWSEEAFTAARELLAERAAGSAVEPAASVAETVPEPAADLPKSVWAAFDILLVAAFIAGVVIGHRAPPGLGLVQITRKTNLAVLDLTLPAKVQSAEMSVAIAGYEVYSFAGSEYQVAAKVDSILWIIGWIQAIVIGAILVSVLSFVYREMQRRAK